jgi:hypothetical protein
MNRHEAAIGVSPAALVSCCPPSSTTMLPLWRSTMREGRDHRLAVGGVRGASVRSRVGLDLNGCRRLRGGSTGDHQESLLHVSLGMNDLPNRAQCI